MIALLFAVVGAFTLVAQTLLLREYLVLHHGSELAIGLFFASWLSWVALAATIVWWRDRRREATASDPLDVHRRLVRLLALYPIALGAQLLAVRASRALCGLGPDEPFGLADQALSTWLTNAPVSIVTGLLFPAGCAAARSLERGPALGPQRREQAGARATRTAAGRATSSAVARVYVAEAIGAFVGGLLCTALLGTALPAVGLGLGTCVLLSAVAAAYAWRRGLTRQTGLHALIALAAASGLAPPWTARLGEAATRARLAELLPRAELVLVADTPYEQTALARLGPSRLLLSNGELVASFPNELAEAARAALVATQPRALQRVLVVGSGAEGLVRALLAFPIGSITYAVPDERAHRLVAPHLPADERAALGDGRVRLAFGDGRRLVDSLAHEPAARFDLVVLALGNPETAAANRYFTLEFYRSVARLLGPGGVLATRTSGAENVLTLEQASLAASVDRTLGRAFTEVVATGGEESWFFASNDHGVVSVDARELAARYQRLPVEPRTFAPEGFGVLLEADRTAAFRQQIDRQARDQGEALVNLDAHPVSYLLGLLVLGRKLDLPLGALLGALREVGPWLSWIPLLLALGARLHYAALAPSHPRRRSALPALVLFAIGLASIALNLVLTFAFQSRFGLLYQQIGLVSALFMAGLGAGAALGARLAPRSRPAAATVAALGSMALWTVAVPSAVAWVGGLADGGSRVLFGGAFVLTGALSGALLPLAARLGAAAPARASAPGRRGSALGAMVAAADHWGAALGAAAAGTLLVPLLGMRVSCQILASLLVAAAALVVGETEPWRTRLERLLRAGRLLRAPSSDRRRRRLLSFPWTAHSYALVVVAAATLLVGAAVRSELVRPGIRLDVRRLGTFIHAERFEERSEPFVHVAAYDAAAERPLNVSLASEAVVRGVAGFGGPLNLLVSMDADGTLRRVELLESQETPAYVRDLGAWLRRLEGRKGTARFTFVESGRAVGEHELDGITGATVSSRAALETVNQAAEAASRDLLGLARAAESPSTPRPASPWSPEVIYLLAAFAVAVAVLLRGPPWLRPIVLGANLAVGGLWLNIQLSLAQLGEIARLALPPPTQVPRLLLLGGVTLLGLAFGPVYCALACPFGAAQELVHRPTTRRATAWLVTAGLGAALAYHAADALGPDVGSHAARSALLVAAFGAAWLGWRRWSLGRAAWTDVDAGAPAPTARFGARARYAKYLLAAVALVAIGAGAWPTVARFDPLAVAFSRRYALAAFLVLGAIVVASTTHFRPFCRHLCPIGALVHWTNKLALARALLPVRRYGACDLGVRSPFDVDCLQCGRCVAHGGRAERRALTDDSSRQALRATESGRAGAPRPPSARPRTAATSARAPKPRVARAIAHRGNRVLLAALAGIGALLAAHGLASDEAPASTFAPASDGPRGERPRDSVDTARIRRLVGEGKLSDHEASHYRPEDSAPAPSSGRAPRGAR